MSAAPAPAEATQATQAGVHESPTQETSKLSTASATLTRATALVAAEVGETFRTDEEGDFDNFGRMPKFDSMAELSSLSRAEAKLAVKQAEDDRAYHGAYEDRPLRKDEYDI